MLNSKFDAFIEKSPISVMARSLLERSLQPEELNRWYDATVQTQYTKELLFSSVFGLMVQVANGTYPSVNAAYQAAPEAIGVTIRSLYNKLNGIEPHVSAGLVRYAVDKAMPIIKDMGGIRLPLLKGFKVKILDGNCIEATEHRLKVLRDTASGALPGKSLVVYDPELGIPIDVFPCEDGHTQERALLPAVLLSVTAGDLWIGDRNFCIRSFITGIRKKEAYSILRQHANLPWEATGPEIYKSRGETGKVYEQPILIKTESGESYPMRRIRIVLDKKTRDDDAELYLLTDLPARSANARKVAQLYSKRWTIETSFQYLEAYFQSEINTLGYPQAALFSFCIAMVAYINVFTIMSVLASIHGIAKVEKEISSYYIVNELSRNYGGMMIAIPAEEWVIFRELTHAEMVEFLKELAKNVRLSAYKKHPRGPKKPKPKLKADRTKPHVSTAKLLAARKKK